MLRLVLAIVGLLFSAAAYAENPKDFTVKSATNDSTFTLSEHKGKVVVLHFLLKTECPFCLRHTHDYAKLAETTPDVLHVFLKPDSVKDIKAWSDELGQSDLAERPTIYRDPDAQLAKQYNIPDGFRFHGQSVHYPALVVLGKDGKELFRYVGKDNTDRMKVADFSEKLKAALQNSSK